MFGCLWFLFLIRNKHFLINVKSSFSPSFYLDLIQFSFFSQFSPVFGVLQPVQINP